MRAEQRLSMLLEIGLVSVEHVIEPWQELLRIVVGVKDDGNAICRGYATNVVSCRNRSCDTSFLVLVVDALTAEVSNTVLADLEDDWAILVSSGLESGHYR